jgi:hypothetical protein
MLCRYSLPSSTIIINTVKQHKVACRYRVAKKVTAPESAKVIFHVLNGFAQQQLYCADAN